MGIAADRLRHLIKQQVNKNIQKLDHDVDCIVEDLRKGKSSGVNVKKTKNFIQDALKLAKKIDKNIETLKKIEKTLEGSRKTSEAARKASVLTAAGVTGAASAALGIAAEFIIEKLKQEGEDLKSVVNIAPSVITNYKDFLTRSAAKIAQAQLEKELKDSVREDRTNMLS